MEVGDYVRTIYGIKRVTNIICGQDVRFDNTDGFDEDLRNYHNYDGIAYDGTTWNEIVERTAPNIIDLIEPNDLLYIDIDDGYAGGIIVPRVPETLEELNKMKENINNGDWILKGIITHEQLESMEYKI